MRKILALVLVGLGGFLIVAGTVAGTWAPGQVERTPLDTDNTTYLSGTARMPNADGVLEETPVLAFSTNRSDSNVSDDVVVAFSSSLCLVRDEDGIDGCVDDPRLISAETDVFATDRHTGMSVDDAKYLPADAKHEEGLQNKWPFDAEKKTYPVWDGTVGGAVDAEYVGTQDIDGLETYVYRAAASADGVDVVDGITGTYTSSTEYYIEPRTGAIINQVIHQERVADGVGTVLDLDLAFTDDQVQTNVDDANDNLSLLTLVETTVPVVGFAVGIPLLLVGLALLVLGRKRSTPTADERAEELAGV